LQVINRVVTVLEAITAGASYWFTPGKVSLGFLMIPDMAAFPCYMVMAGEKGGAIEHQLAVDDHDEDFTISIKGVVKASKASDAVTANEKALRDIRKAINDDSKSAATGSLGDLTVKAWFTEGPDMDDGYLMQGYGFFDQRLNVTINGQFGEL
jgi:hypothetical protein